MKVPEAEEKVRETIVEIRKAFTNKKWCKWADAWLSGTDRSVESAISIAEDMARRRAPAKTTAGRPSSRGGLLSLAAGNAALAAAIVARSSGELDQFAALMLEEYVKGRVPPPPSKEGGQRQ